MGRITVELLRRRAEHNEGCLSNLKEIALHQQDIEKIELIGDACRQLEIVYLCNNYISKIEGLRHLKWLKYLNLAVNNIVVIEGLQGCEALERLDLTLNFIADMTCVQTLLANPFLESLHLTGNPCTKAEGYRAYVVHTLPQLKELDGDEIIRSERITARQAEDVVIEVAEEVAVKVREAERIKQEMFAKGIDPFPPKYNEQGERVYGHTPEERLQMLQEQKEQERKRREEQANPLPGSISAVHKELREQQRSNGVRLTPEEEKAKFGRLLLRNEGRVPFHFDQDGAEEVVLTVEPGKFISTTLLAVTVEVDAIRVMIKGKLLQVPVEGELAADAAQVQRSTTTGQLKITVPYTPEVRERRSAAQTRFDRLRVTKTNIAGVVTPRPGKTELVKPQCQNEAGNSNTTHNFAVGPAPVTTTTSTMRSSLLDIEKRMSEQSGGGEAASGLTGVSEKAESGTEAQKFGLVTLVEEITLPSHPFVQNGDAVGVSAQSESQRERTYWDDLD